MEVFLDSILDTLKVFPFILVIYILIEFLEHKTSFSSNHRLLQGKLAPLIGTVTGIIPQCGFSVMAAKLYDKKYIRTGTLIAVFLATSDEALIVLIVNPAGAAAVAPLIAVKVVVGLIAGYAINFILRNEHLAQPEESDRAFTPTPAGASTRARAPSRFTLSNRSFTRSKSRSTSLSSPLYSTISSNITRLPSSRHSSAGLTSNR